MIHGQTTNNDVIVVVIYVQVRYGGVIFVSENKKLAVMYQFFLFLITFVLIVRFIFLMYRKLSFDYLFLLRVTFKTPCLAKRLAQRMTCLVHRCVALANPCAFAAFLT